MSLKIYFCGSISAGREDAPLYVRIIDHLKTYGKVLTEHVGRNPNVVENEESLVKDNLDKFIHDRDVEWLTESDVLIAEVTKPSLGVGYEIGRAVAMNKPCMCLFRPVSDYSLSCMIQGAHDGEKFIVKHYAEPDVFQIIDDYMSTFKKT